MSRGSFASENTNVLYDEQMKALKNLLNDQKGMTGLETAIILIAFVTVAAVFGYAVLSAGLFSAERGKETIYAGLNEARSNLELSGSVMAKSDDSVNVRSILFTVKNAIAGQPIDMTPNDGSGHNKCVISLQTNNDYINNVKWSFVPIGANNGNNLLETGEQFEISVDLTDLGSAGSLSDNLTANQTFTLQVKPSLGSTITIQRQLPPAIGPVMDLDLMTSFGGGSGSGGSGSSGGGSLVLVGSPQISAVFGYVNAITFTVQNSGSNPIDMTPNMDATEGLNTTVISLTTPGAGTLNNVLWMNTGSTTLAPEGQCTVTLDLDQIVNPSYDPLSPTFVTGAYTIRVRPQGGSTLTISGMVN
jgi:flagellin FlaB